VYVKSALRGLKFYIGGGDGFSNRRMFQNHRKTLPISHVHLKTFGHTRENSPEFLRELMARVVPSRVLAGGR
jgi:hypothetical protein